MSQNVPSLFLGRLNTNESFDAAFANNGKSTYFSSPGAFIGCNAAALQADGKILVTGSKIVASNNYLSSYLTARFLNAQAVTIASVNKIAQPAIQSVIGAGISPNPVVNNLIRLTIPVLRSAQITISVYDASGNVITAPYAKEMSAGLHTEAI